MSDASAVTPETEIHPADHADPSVPLTPEGATRFPPEPVDHAGLEATLAATLSDLRDRTALDPFSNPLLLLAVDITRRIDRAEISFSGLEQLVQRLTVEAFADRARRLGRYLGETDPDENETAITRLIDGLAETRGFAAFKALVERASFGVVFTAHPTFAMPRDASRTLVELATGHALDGSKLDDAGRAERLAGVAHIEHRPPTGLSLVVEQSWSMEALSNAHDALQKIHAIVFGVAARHRPDQWRTLTPRLVTLASWVGYDHDGRADITWLQTLARRLVVKQAVLDRHAATVTGVLDHLKDPSLRDLIAPARHRLEAAAGAVARQLAALEAAERDPSATPAFDRAMVDLASVALTDTVALREELTTAIEAAGADPEARRALLVLRASLATHGLGLAHTHVRLNSTQLHNAVRKLVGLETSPADPAHRRSYFNMINDLLGRASPVTINMGSLALERSSAKRMAMIVAQMLKHIDSETPVRFLIAETESGFTLLTALYYAKLFGVADKVEISPLFETEAALAHGEALIEEALRSPHYAVYLRSHGRLAVQFGFSDSGRYMGQMAATFAIERLRLRLGELLAEYGLADIEVVLFNTHGDSIGRGGHPASLADRFRYVAPPANRADFARRGIKVKEEVSFQGGDGYLPFFSRTAAFATLRQVLDFALDTDPEGDGDPIYDYPDFASEFFATVQQQFSRLVDDPDYAALLGMYGTNLLYPTGSRPAKRQSENWANSPGIEHPSQLRAIPNNAVLQQLGMLANTLYGVGRAAAKDPDLFEMLLERSPRFGRAMGMVRAALEASDLDVLRGYIDSFDPGMWLTRSGRTRRPSRSKELRELSKLTEHAARHDRLARVLRRLQADHLRLVEYMPTPTSDRRDRLILVHAIRVAVLHRIYLQATHIPEFSLQHDVTWEQMLERVLHLDVANVVAKLVEIFPKDDPTGLGDADFAEPATYRATGGQTYEQEHERIFDPLVGLFELSRRAGTAITYLIGAVG